VVGRLVGVVEPPVAVDDGAELLLLALIVMEGEGCEKGTPSVIQAEYLEEYAHSKAIQTGANTWRALRWCRDPRGISNRVDRTKAFRRLLIRQDLSIRGINTGIILTIPQAALKHVGSIRGGSVKLAPDPIVNVFAIASGIRTARIACLQAELTSTHEIVPFDGLDVAVGVSVGCGEGVGEE
jgi:hypothetical protein